MLGLFTGTPITQTGHTHLRYVPGWLRPDYASRPIRGVELYASLVDCCLRRHVRSVGLYRTYALGDILLLLPVARALARRVGLERVTIITTRYYWGCLRAMNLDDPLIRFAQDRGAVGEITYGCDVHYNVNSVLEADHAGGPESDRHRVELYALAMGFDGARAA